MTPCVRFTNAVLTDVTESLFSALKRWIYGAGRVSPTLLLAIVRIANGCLGLINKPTLKDVQTTMKEIVRSTDSQACRYLFKVFAQRLTRWAANFMYERFNKNRDNYDMNKFSKRKKRRVTHRRTGEVHTVDHKFECVCAGTPCWQRVYTGCLCSHGVSVCIDRLSRCDLKAQKKICEAAVKACNKNWFRKTYSDDKYRYRVPMPLPTENVAASIHADVTLSKLKARFVGLASFMDADVVNRFLNGLEDHALSSGTNSPISVVNPPPSSHGTMVPKPIVSGASLSSDNDDRVPVPVPSVPTPKRLCSRLQQSSDTSAVEIESDESDESDAEDTSQQAAVTLRPFTCLLPISDPNSIAAGARGIVEGGYLARGMRDTCGEHPNKYPGLQEQTSVLKMSGSVKFVEKLQISSAKLIKEMTEAGRKWQVMVEALSAECMHGCSLLQQMCVSPSSRIQPRKRK